MHSFKKWFSKVTLGQPEYSMKLIGWMFLDNYMSSIPFGIMLMAVFAFFGPIIDPVSALPVKRILILCGVLLLQSILYYFTARKSYILACTGFADVIKKGRLDMGEQLRQLPMGFYNFRDSGDLTTVLLRDYETVEANCSSLVPKVAIIAARMSLALIILTVFDWRMMLVTIGVIPLALPLAVLSYRSLAGKNLKLLRIQKENTSRILEYVGGIQTLKAFNQSDEMFKTIRESCDDLRKASLALEDANAPLGMLARTILNAGTAIVMGFGGFWMMKGSLSPLTLIVFLMLALNIYNPILTLMMLVVNVTRLNHCADRIEEIMEEELLDHQDKAVIGSRYPIIFKDVSFGYGQDEVLHHLSFEIPPCGITALIGPSGSGKSTITRLIARFWDVSSGTIEIGETVINEINPDEILKHISVVFQDVYLFHDTIEANIRMGNEEASRAEVITAAKRAACHEFIESLPEGYETVVGEAGSTLSGGEKQRISIARALLKDAPIILLDEATASLDPENEINIQHAIDELVKDKTVIVIAHRLRSIQAADQIIVLDQGQVVQTGTHSELVRQKGLYCYLWEEQQKAGSWQLSSI